MTDRGDFWKSLVRGAANRARDGLDRFAPVARAKEKLAEIANRRTAIDERTLATAIAHAQGVAAASVGVRRGKIRIDATFDDGEAVALCLVPAGTTFVPRGPKELRFRVEPPEAALRGRAQDLAAAIAGAIAHSLYRILLRGDRPLTPAIVDRDRDLLRIDLRSIPEIRALVSQPAKSVLLDALHLGTLTAEDGDLRLTLALP